MNQFIKLGHIVFNRPIIKPDRKCSVFLIEIVIFPGPDRSVTQDNLNAYKVINRRYRNRRIGEFLKEMRLTEGRNTGFRKILRALEHNGSPLPEFETNADHSYFITRLFIREGFTDWKRLLQKAIDIYCFTDII